MTEYSIGIDAVRGRLHDVVARRDLRLFGNYLMLCAPMNRNQVLV